jgi:hypothetical protein
LTTGLSARFKDNEGRLNFQGRALSGLISNFVTLVAVFILPKSDSSSTVFVIYLVVGDVGMILFYALMTNFFKHCLADIYNKTSTEHFIDTEYEMTERKKPATKPSLSAQNSINDITRNHDESTLSYTEIFYSAPDTFIGMVFVFTVTLCCFPVLVFRLDIGLSAATKYVILTFVFNLGDTLSRYFYMSHIITNQMYIHALNASRILFPFLMVWCINATDGLLSWSIVKFLVVFTFAFSNGYLCMSYFDQSAARFDCPYNSNRSGNLVAIALEIGLMLGAISALVW